MDRIEGTAAVNEPPARWRRNTLVAITLIGISLAGYLVGNILSSAGDGTAAKEAEEAVIRENADYLLTQFGLSDAIETESAQIIRHSEELGDRENAALSVGESDGAQDDEWESFQRIKSNFPRDAALRGQDLKPAKLFRHTRLNPGDRYIPKEARDLFSELVSHHAEMLSSVVELQSRLAAEDFNRLFDANRARKLNIAETLIRLPEEKREAYLKLQSSAVKDYMDSYERQHGEAPTGPAPVSTVTRVLFPDGRIPMVTRSAGGEVSYANLTELPNAVRANGLRQHLSMELAGVQRTSATGTPA